MSKLRKQKNKASKPEENSDSDTDSEKHELSHYVNDRVKLMKQVLKIIKPRKIKAMAPDSIKDLDVEEINSMLLEELLGISNRRLKYIFSGVTPPDDASSTDPENDVISLSDISDDDLGEIGSDDKKPATQEKLMSVLELLELQARARAIRSQLVLETDTQKEDEVATTLKSDTDEDAVIVTTPRNDEIVIESSDSDSKPEPTTKKIKLIRDRVTGRSRRQDAIYTEPGASDSRDQDSNAPESEATTDTKPIEVAKAGPCPDEHDEDEIILIVDQEEMATIMAGI